MDEWTYKLIMQLQERLNNLEEFIISKFPEEEKKETYKPKDRQ